MGLGGQAARAQQADSLNVNGHNTARQQKRTQHKEKINSLIRREEEGVLAYNKQYAFGIKLATDGYGLSYEVGWMKTLNRTTILQFELNEKKNNKEDKKTPVTGAFTAGTPFIYGKQNNFYQFKVGMGEQRTIGGKGNKNGVGVTYLYAGGLSLGMLKPYYLQVQDPNTNEIKTIKYSQADSAQFLSTTNIVGGGGFSRGWGEMKFKPGIHGKLAFRFDYGRYNELLSAIEVGINAEYYTSKIPIMLLIPNKQFFFNSYVTILFGKRK